MLLQILAQSVLISASHLCHNRVTAHQLEGRLHKHIALREHVYQKLVTLSSTGYRSQHTTPVMSWLLTEVWTSGLSMSILKKLACRHKNGVVSHVFPLAIVQYGSSTVCIACFSMQTSLHVFLKKNNLPWETQDSFWHTLVLSSCMAHTTSQ